MSKPSIPEIREQIKQLTSALRVADDIDRLLLCDDIDRLIEQARRAPNKPKELTPEVVEAPLGKPKAHINPSDNRNPDVEPDGAMS